MSTSNTTPKPQFRAAAAGSSAPRTAKLFKNGRSQAVRLPKEFRFEGKEVAVRRDPVTGDVLLSSRTMPGKQAVRRATANASTRTEKLDAGTAPASKLTLPELYAIFDQADFPEDFFERKVHMPRKLDLF
jgi:virulence-associated protein VagC